MNLVGEQEGKDANIESLEEGLWYQGGHFIWENLHDPLADICVE